MRLFIAVPLSGEMRAALTAVQEELRRRGARGTYTREENLHLTLAFIGEYPAPDAVISAMESVPFPAVSLALDGAGSFGEVWWAGLRESEALAAYVKRLRRALAEAGIPFDRKRFSPHITLLRRPGISEAKGLAALPVPAAVMTADRVCLMRSDRGKRGMIYTELGDVAASGGR
ncbi:MAG: RNA 2',3'-cyclic phosphodiesterase [Oscillospiraceae bacterium]|nr:RNA 2',3'-cyclic phosphodiesterase [Oscillospiraceae bacterium]